MNSNLFLQHFFFLLLLPHLYHFFSLMFISFFLHPSQTNVRKNVIPISEICSVHVIWVNALYYLLLRLPISVFQIHCFCLIHNSPYGKKKQKTKKKTKMEINIFLFLILFLKYSHIVKHPLEFDEAAVRFLDQYLKKKKWKKNYIPLQCISWCLTFKRLWFA